MQKNKIDAVKAVFSSAVKKLAVLSLAVAVSSGADASATPPERNKPGLSSTTQGEEAPQDRLRRLERERDELFRQANEMIDKSFELEQKRKNADLLSTLPKAATSRSGYPLLKKRICLRLKKPAI